MLIRKMLINWNAHSEQGLNSKASSKAGLNKIVASHLVRGGSIRAMVITGIGRVAEMVAGRVVVAAAGRAVLVGRVVLVGRAVVVGGTRKIDLPGPGEGGETIIHEIGLQQDNKIGLRDHRVIIPRTMPMEGIPIPILTITIDPLVMALGMAPESLVATMATVKITSEPIRRHNQGQQQPRLVVQADPHKEAKLMREVEKKLASGIKAMKVGPHELQIEPKDKANTLLLTLIVEEKPVRIERQNVKKKGVPKLVNERISLKWDRKA
jgi:hypothetical protein